MASSSTRRKSAFQETGLTTADITPPTPLPSSPRSRPQSVRFRSKDEVHVVERYEDHGVDVKEHENVPSDERTTYIPPSTRFSQSPLPEFTRSIMYRIGFCALLIAAAVPLLPRGSILGEASVLPIQGVNGGPIPGKAAPEKVFDLGKRADSPTDICFRWAQQSAVVNGTLYLYGGEATTQSSQTENTWNNNFLTLDLTKTWDIQTPPLVGLPQPSGPPAVSLGYLWNSYDSLYIYGGEFSWKPPVDPVPFALWEYDIQSSSWVEHSNPETSAGNSASGSGEPVQRAAEGAGVSVPSLGRGFYFGGHLDGYTTPGWSQSIYREYLQSLLEYTYPGYTNSQVDSLKSGSDAGSDGVYRNITEGGLQSQAGFTERADGLLIYVPGFGVQGVLLALAGGTNTTFTQMNTINVYDIATSSWYLQSTTGPTPNIRVNPCAVIAAAPDGSSYNIYMFGGQNLTPYGNQSQFSDMWILTLPTFTWIQVDQGGQSVPYGRSGATCNIWDAQMVMVGGYVGNQLTCESPGIYVFDLSNLQWVRQFTALSTQAGDNSDNPLNQQPNQKAAAGSPGGLEGSYGYQVPDAVISVIGGGKTGGATITTPIVTATAGPLATGKPQTWTVTGSNGATITETAVPGNSGNSTEGTSGKSGPNIAAIVVGVVCGLLFVLICYLLFCLFLYRKQLALYKRHVEMSQRQARGEKPPVIPGLWTSDSAKSSTERRAGPNAAFAAGEGSSQAGSHGISQTGSGGQSSSTAAVGAVAEGYQSVRRDSDQSSTDDLLAGHEPTFVGVMLHPRRSLRVTNRD